MILHVKKIKSKFHIYYKNQLQNVHCFVKTNARFDWTFYQRKRHTKHQRNNKVEQMCSRLPLECTVAQRWYSRCVVFVSITRGTIKLMKGKALRKQSLHAKTAASVLLKLFISSNEWCHTTDAPYVTLCHDCHPCATERMLTKVNYSSFHIYL